MIEPNDLKLTLVDVISALASQQFKFHLTGGLASSFYGEPRFTQDIDIVIRIDVADNFTSLIQALSQKFIVDSIAVKDAIRRQGIFQALHEQSIIKVDFHVGEAIQGELNRSKSEEMLSGLVVPVVSREDAVLSKLIWISKGSNKSRLDVKTILKRQHDIDFEYLNSKATELKVESILKELQAELASGKTGEIS